MNTVITYRRIAAVFLCLAGAFLFDQCDESTNYFEEETITQNAGVGQMEAYDALEVGYLTEVKLAIAKTVQITYDCTVATNDVVNKIITLNFGACAAIAYPYGRARSGSMYIKYENAIGDTLSKRTITFTDYFVSSKKLEGTIVLDSIYRGETDTLLHGVCRLIDFKVSYPDGTSVTYNSTQERVWTSGENDNNPLNNTYQVTSLRDSLCQTGPSVHSFTTLIVTPVRLNFSCANFGTFAALAGKVDVQSLSDFSDAVRSVNYGAGTCDNAVTVSAALRTFTAYVN